MRATRRNRSRRTRHNSWVDLFLLLVLAAALRWAAGPAAAQPAPAPPARGQEAGASDGLFITVRNPITSEVVQYVKDKTDAARLRWKAADRVGIIVYDFNPDNRPAGTSDFHSCLGLATYLRKLDHVQTVAFVHNKVNRHTVLPVLACKELVMSRESGASIGDILHGSTESLDKIEKMAYFEATQPENLWALVWKMFDKNIEVWEGRKNTSTWYVAKGHVPPGVVIVGKEPVVLQNDTGLYDTDKAYKLGLCRLIRDSREAVATAYGMHPSSLREDPLGGREPKAWHLAVRGPVTKALDETLRRRIRRAVGQGANLIFLQLECAGGDTVVAGDLANFLATLKDDRGNLPVMTVAYIPEKAPDTATFLALGCSEIVMHKDPANGKEAELGDFENIVYERRGNHKDLVDEGSYRMLRGTLAGLAEKQGYSPLVAQGMLDQKLVIHRVRSRLNPAESCLLSKEQLDEDRQQAHPQWIDEGVIKQAGQFLKLSSTLALDLRVARHVVESPEEMYARYQARGVKEAGPDWLDALAAFLRHPMMSFVLVMIGIVCLVLELKLPGVGLPGILAALCFVLFFWAHSQLAGQITMLAVLLFVLGIILIGLEIFVLPGFGVTGISGVVLLVVSLGLATLEKKPETAAEWLSFGNTLTTFGLGLVGAVILAAFVGRYLPNIPYANRLVLAPQGESEEGMEAAAGTLAAETAAALLGAIGVAATTLRPAGMARFGDDFIDVVAEGSYVAPGARVQVIEIEGNRIVVKEV